ncbi:hypothetical protein DRW07_12350 [Alteromonas sediminis]|uniref:tRNA-modifying protein YgfZ-like beta-barrel domain-containing protein n=1 Tax=Alteromonas sediminis TaxID=2259342 RepID=A0A3N5YKU7_9ALTE|nr:hypothetical protein [Alteromonas sediminis]RPJ65611.1 hypothetical protein DRW07_12350 [Alteromonas sediminis]
MQTVNALNDLPNNAILSLSSLAILEISGVDAKTFLQGQLTIDVQSLSSEQARIGAQCDPKGKMVGLGHIVQVGESVWFIQHEEGIESSLSQFTKYGVFAKAECHRADGWQGFLFVGDDAIEQAKSMEVVYSTPHFENAIFGWTTQTKPSFSETVPVYDGKVFDAYTIANGIPLLRQNMAGEWVPQMTNIQALNGIDFDKGCYLGQETVARTRYLGKNKRQCYIVKSQPLHQDLSKPGTPVEMRMGENWRKSGTIIYSACLANEAWSLCVMPNDLTPDAELRIQPNFDLSIVALPYDIAQEASLIKKRR